MTAVEQLSLNVLPHPQVRHRDGMLIAGTLKVQPGGPYVKWPEGA